MAINFPGPYEVRINYTSGGRDHQQRLNVRVAGTPVPGVDDFTTIDALRRDDSPFALDAEVDAWVALLQPFYNNATSSFTTAELWSYVPESFDASFVAAYALGVNGSSASAVVPASQLIFTFRTQEGGIMKINLMDNILAPADKDAPPYPGTSQAVANAIVLGTSPWLARDTSYAIASIGLYPGQNERLFKKQYR